jgi:transcriptional regulator with XRE-family HTH domain
MRLLRGWTQEALGERCGIDQSVVSRLELGRVVQVRLRRLFDLLGALGVSDVFLVPVTPADADRVLSSVDELYLRGRWSTADAVAREQIEAILSRRRSA